jgi:hypothetical protein
MFLISGTPNFSIIIWGKGVKKEHCPVKGSALLEKMLQDLGGVAS